MPQDSSGYLAILTPELAHHWSVESPLVHSVSGLDYLLDGDIVYINQDGFVRTLYRRNSPHNFIKKIVKKRASSYGKGSDSVFYNSDYTNMQILFSIGGLYSTVKDLLIWEQSFSTNKLLKKTTVEEIFTPGKGNYGYGWWIDKLGSCRRMYHDGGITDFSASLKRLPDSNLTVIAISNRGEDGGIRVAYDVAGKICGVPATIRGIQPELMRMDSEKLIKIVNDARSLFPIFDVQERKVEEIGNYLMLLKEKNQAIEVFKLNVMLYPKSGDAHCKLATAYESVGDKTLAVKNFKLCLELDPTNKIALERLKKLD